jgi:outer membrane lipoprotein-sorting protein
MSPCRLVLWIVPLCIPGDGEKLLREMDATIAAAKTLRIEFVIEMRQSEQVARGWLALADGNRFRHEVKLGDQTSVVVSDGRRVGGPRLGEVGSLFPKAPLPAWHNEVLQSWLGRGGTFLSLMAVYEQVNQRPGETPGFEDRPRASNSKLLSDEEVNGARTRVVEYDLTWSATAPDFRTAKVRVWIDPKTKLPVRRTMTFGDKPGGERFTATHTKFEIDPKLDDTIFEIPR